MTPTDELRQAAVALLKVWDSFTEDEHKEYPYDCFADAFGGLRAAVARATPPAEEPESE